MGLWAENMGAGFVLSPETIVMLGFWARRVADALLGLRVKARISKGEEERRAEITAPPCLPVPPVMRCLRRGAVIVSAGDFVVVVVVGLCLMTSLKLALRFGIVSSIGNLRD